MNRPSESCVLAVHELTEALTFYRDVLGFEVHAVSVSPPSQPEARISLQAQEVPPADGRRLVFLTDDCDVTFERIEAAGAEVMQEPITQPDGTRDCAFLDPSGNLVRFTQPRQ
ncbi:VOC family protein [Amycolatopsis magusensis]|uniref:VOC family protein n=1 Tax=Amycolatopsis magusensis TaxID=882444 RepID=UPI0024A7CE13|nr:VOC family protein [Amycolatopsis magusensis]MDI5977886.1 VOC family protein [Amycolatopsis magusensis]